MSLPSDFNKTTVVSYALIVWVAGISFALGRQFAKIEDAEKERQDIRNYVEQEVGGLRSDWERDKKIKEQEIRDLNKKVFGK